MKSNVEKGRTKERCCGTLISVVEVASADSARVELKVRGSMPGLEQPPKCSGGKVALHATSELANTPPWYDCAGNEITILHEINTVNTF